MFWWSDFIESDELCALTSYVLSDVDQHNIKKHSEWYNKQKNSFFILKNIHSDTKIVKIDQLSRVQSECFNLELWQPFWMSYWISWVTMNYTKGPIISKSASLTFQTISFDTILTVTSLLSIIWTNYGIFEVVATILKNGRHLIISSGQRIFAKQLPYESIHTKFDACITKCVIFFIICPAMMVRCRHFWTQKNIYCF